MTFRCKMFRSLASVVALAALAGCVARPVRAQQKVTPLTVTQTIFTAQSTPAIVDIDQNAGQTLHFLSYSFSSGNQIDIRLEAAFGSGSPIACPASGSALWFPISQDVTDNTFNGSGTVFATGAYPCLRVNLLSINGTVSASYAGTSASFPPVPPAYNGSQQFVYSGLRGIASPNTGVNNIDAPFATTLGTIYVLGTTSGGGVLQVRPIIAGTEAAGRQSFTLTAITAGIESLQVSSVPVSQITLNYTCTGPAACSSDPTSDLLTFYYVFQPITATNTAQVGGANIVSAGACQQAAQTPVVINTTASAKLVSGAASKQIYICGFQIVPAAADNVALVEGTGTTCGTSTAGMAGGATAATGWNLTANENLNFLPSEYAKMRTATAGDDVCVLVSAATQLSGILWYVQQ